MWDILFAENLEVDLIDLVCVAMLLRIRQRCEIHALYPSNATGVRVVR